MDTLAKLRFTQEQRLYDVALIEGEGMASFAKLWAGRVYGTNTGNLFMELNVSDGKVTGVLRFMDSAFGLTVYKLAGSFDEQLHLHGEVMHVSKGVDAGPIEVIATLTEQGNLRGEWNSTIARMKRCQEPFLLRFLGRPRGRTVPSKFILRIMRSTHPSVPYGCPRATHRRRSSTSMVVCGSLTHFTQSRGGKTGQAANHSWA